MPLPGCCSFRIKELNASITETPLSAAGHLLVGLSISIVSGNLFMASDGTRLGLFDSRLVLSRR
jgi:hypothetical protein